jgi:hypothetical protein
MKKEDLLNLKVKDVKRTYKGFIVKLIIDDDLMWYPPEGEDIETLKKINEKRKEDL